MLLNVLKVHDIVTVKLATGEEIVGSLDNADTKNSVDLKKPLRVVLTDKGATFAPYMMSVEFDNETRYQIARSAVAVIQKTAKSYATAYAQSCSSLTAAA